MSVRPEGQHRHGRSDPAHGHPQRRPHDGQPRPRLHRLRLRLLHEDARRRRAQGLRQASGRTETVLVRYLYSVFSSFSVSAEKDAVFEGYRATLFQPKEAVLA